MRIRALLAAMAVAVITAQTAGAAPTEHKYGYNPETFEIKSYLQPRYSDLFSGDSADENSFGVRRARFYLTSTVAPNIKGRLQVNVVPDKVELLDAYLEWTPWKADYPAFSVTMGNFKKPFSYQEFVMSSSDLNLIDRTYTNSVLEKKLFASSYDLGVMATADLWEYDVPVILNLAVVNGTEPGTRPTPTRTSRSSAAARRLL